MTRMVDTIVVHCSATPYGKDYSAADIDRWHRARGWLMCGYHFVIRLDGTIESAAKGNRTRPLEKAGAHVGGCGAGWNKRSIGICLIGGLDENGDAKEDGFNDEQYQALYSLLLELDLDYPDCDILGHRDLIELTNSSPKACPCFDVKPWLAKQDENTLYFEGVLPLEDNLK